jgi:tetratricopeptide (TPR) repeat protein/predicted Ser/Thr protein kinase
MAPMDSLPPEVTAANPDARCGKYVRVLRLGAGAMGEVWKAWDTGLARWVALKLLKDSKPAEIARFKREAQLAAKLNHAHIAAVYDVGEDGGRHFIAMQLVEGRPLSNISRAHARRAAELVQQAASAVHFAHEHGVIHRDLKPGNLMVVDGAAPHVYVMDFGLAKSTTVGGTLSATGDLLGTPAYMSPEQARGHLKVDARTDVYALGATLYDLLSGGPPFRAPDLYRLLTMVVESEPPPLAGVPSDLATIVMKCLQKDAAHRYATARDLADDLGRFLAGEPIAARPASTIAVLRRRIRKHAMMIVAVAVAVVALAGWAAQAHRSRHRPPAPPPPTPPPLAPLSPAQQRVADVMRRWHELASVRASLEKLWADSSLDGDARRRKAEVPLAAVAAFVCDIPDDPGATSTAKAIQAWALWQAGRESEATPLWSEALAGGRDYPFAAMFGALAAHLAFADICYTYSTEGSGRFLRVRTAAENVPSLRKCLTDLESWIRRARGATAWPAATADDIELIAVGARALCGDNWAGAERAYTNAMESATLKDYSTLFLLPRFRARLGLGDWAGAEADLREAMRRHPEWGGAFGFMGRLRYIEAAAAQGTDREEPLLEESIAWCAKAEPLLAAPGWTIYDRATSHRTLGEHHRATGRDPRAALTASAADFRRAIALQPQPPGTWTRLAGVLIARSEAEASLGADPIPTCREAIEVCDEAARRYANDAYVYNWRGTAWRRLGDEQVPRKIDARAAYESALADQARARKIEPALTDAYHESGLVCLNLASLDARPRLWLERAVAEFDETLARAPSAGAHHNRGLALERLGRLDEAITAFEAALKLAPELRQAQSALERVRKAVRDR